MFLKKVLGKTVAATATTGLLAAPLAFATSPQLMNVACTDNPSETSTTLVLQRTEAQYGTKVLATASVDPVRKGDLVTFTLSGASRSQSIDKRIGEKGNSQWLLPRGLVADNTYTVTARYGECVADTAQYTVRKATSKPAPSVTNARKAKFRTTVTGGGGLGADAGPVTFRVRKKGGAWIREDRTFLNDGVAKVNLDNLKKGRYVLRVNYEGNRNFLAGATKMAFRVR